LDHYNLRQYCVMSVPIAKHAIVKHLEEAMLLEFKNEDLHEMMSTYVCLKIPKNDIIQCN